MIRLVGLDPGLRRTGWGVLEVTGSGLRAVACGVVAAPERGSLARRLEALYGALEEVLRAYDPVEAAVEETVVNRNPATSLKLGQARGVALLAAARAGIEVHEYAAKRIKQAVTGTGGASKEQVWRMVRVLLPGIPIPSADAADALAAALCHAHHRRAVAAVGGGGR